MHENVSTCSDRLGFLPKVMHFCANSSKAFQTLQTILLTYAEEADYDNRLVNLISELVFKIHFVCRLEQKQLWISYS